MLYQLHDMFFYSLIWVLHSDIILAASLPRSPDNVDRLVVGPTSSSNSASATNILITSNNNASSGNRLKIECDAREYGRNLKVDSCRNVFKFMRRDDTQYAFAERDSGVPFDVPLPFRTLSSKTPRDT